MQGVLRKNLNNNQVFGALGNVDITIIGDQRHILNANAKLAGQVDAGFRGAQRTGGHGVGIAGVGVGCLVDLQAQAVAIAMSATNRSAVFSSTHSPYTDIT